MKVWVLIEEVESGPPYDLDAPMGTDHRVVGVFSDEYVAKAKAAGAIGVDLTVEEFELDEVKP